MSASSQRAFTQASVWTGDPRNPRATSFAVRDGRFTAVGDHAEVAAAIDRHTRFVDLAGAAVVPGFHDAHTHLSSGSLTATWVDLQGASGPRDAAQRVSAAARLAGAGRWIRGWGWDQTRWSPPVWPSRGDLDDLVPEHPALLTRGDGHVAWLNGAALRRLGWDHRTPDPEGGSLVRDPRSQEPTGIALERAADLAAAAIPPPSGDERRSAVEWGIAQARAFGITSIEDVAESWAFDTYDAIRDSGGLTARIHAWLPFHAPRDEASELRRLHPPDDPWLGTGTLKLFLDGTLGSRSAALHEPYADAPGSRGELREDSERLPQQLREASRDGWSFALHAIGDRAVTLALDLLAGLPPSPRNRPHRVEHVQMIRRADIARLVSAGIVASVQPVHFLDDAHWIEQRLGRERAAGAYPLRSLLDAGAQVALGTDWPIASLDPLRNILAASIARAKVAGPSRNEALTLESALSAATFGPAAARAATQLGRIAPGFHADFVVLSGDPLELLAGEAAARLRVQGHLRGRSPRLPSSCRGSDLLGEERMTVRIVRLGSPRAKDEGLRIGTVRRPPRGVPKSEYAIRDLYDVWLPNLAPSEELLKAARGSTDERSWRSFERRYRAEMSRPETSRIWDLLAALSHGVNFSIGCYCEHESRCHRSIMRDILRTRAASITVVTDPRS